jgi:hypothetical protein
MRKSLHFPQGWNFLSTHPDHTAYTLFDFEHLNLAGEQARFDRVMYVA